MLSTSLAKSSSSTAPVRVGITGLGYMGLPGPALAADTARKLRAL